jgi:peptide/nickel transport system substrate-binding protein
MRRFLQTMKMKISFLILTFIFALSLTACGTSEPAPAAPTTPEAPVTGTVPAPATEEPADEAPAPVAGTGGEVVWVTMSESPSIDTVHENDSATNDLTRQIFEGLTWIHPTRGLEPNLAESIDISADGLTYTFNLRQGIQFHDGTPFNAEAVQMSLTRAVDPEVAAPAAFIIDMINSVNVVDDYTVEIVIDFPFSPFLAHMASPIGFIIAPSALNEAAAGGRTVTENPIGTGPFMFVYRNHGDYTRITPNPNHWRNVPVHDIIFRIIPDTATRLAMLDTGEGNAMAALASQVHELYMMPHVDWWRIESNGLTYIGFQTEREGPLADARVRRAITMAINKMDILYGVQEGEGIPAVGPVRGGVVAHAPTDVQGLPFDPDAARALLEEAGWGDGFSTTIWTNEGNAVRARISELVQSNLAAIGIDLEIQILEWGTYLERTGEGLHDMFLLGWSTITGDSDYGIFPLFHSGEIGAANRLFYNNPRVDELLEEGRRATVAAERDRIYREVTEILVYDAPMIFLFHPDTPVVTNGVSGVQFNFSAAPYFYSARLN